MAGFGPTLVEKFQGIVDGYYAGSDAYKEVVDALTFLDQTRKAVEHDSLASDGLEMIQAVIADMERESQTDSDE